MSGSIEGFITGGMTSNHCFVAGTLVQTIDGAIPNEQIEEGEFVLSEDPETGDVTYKRVLETYINETEELIHLIIEDEEIVTTPTHPFFVKGLGFVNAGDLKEGTLLLDSEGNELHLQIKRWEYLQDPIQVYNFAVEDYHTYFVGSINVLVHNRCKLGMNMIKSGIPDPGSAYDAHHIFPQKFRPYFEAVGLDIDDPQFGLFIERHLHLSSKDEYNAMWWDFLKQYTVEEWPNHQLEFLEFLRTLKTVF